MFHFFVICLLSTILFAKGSVDTKIEKTTKELNSYTKNYSKINKKMAKTAKAIILQKREIEKQTLYIQKLQKELEQKAQSYKANGEELKGLKSKQNALKKQREKIEEALVFTIAQSVSLSIVLEENYSPSTDAVIEIEVLKKMLQRSQQQVDALSQKYIALSSNAQLLQNRSKTLKRSIDTIDEKRKELLKKQSQNKKALIQLQKAKKSYKKELTSLLQRQNTLKQTLSHLNIIKIDQERKAQEEKEQKEALKNNKIVLDNKNLPKVKKHGSSYKALKTIKYRGSKTIAPLNSYTITKKYGTYTDPIYGIKIFNESISLKPKRADAKVRTVFNGKVIYADKTAVLDNIVIVEHSNGLHTIYANLSQIAPGVKKGKKVKKGYTIGRVKDELVFEVTQKSYHINPIRLFR